MTDLENALRSASAEIRQLRRENEVLRAKVDMIELFDRVFSTQPLYRTTGYGEDIAWRLDKIVEGMNEPMENVSAEAAD